jgi:2-polyprenyl-3-methyl-5-hydroxy-6-metoxy-1,4-benzoquinol methylase
MTYKSGGSILDLGCSSGGFLRSLDPDSWIPYGIEMSAEVARHAEVNAGAQVFVGDILDAPFTPNSFDAITCFHVFEHLYQPREVLKKVSTWLKPGGIFFTMMPNIDSAGARIFKSYWYALELPRHLYHFSPASLRHLAQSVGLREVSLTTNREVFIEESARYMVDDLRCKMGSPRAPMAKRHPRSLARRAVRKGFRITILPVLNALASLAGNGESIHAVFTKV